MPISNPSGYVSYQFVDNRVPVSAPGSIFPATFPNCADAILALKNREQREGTRAVPDSPNLNLSLVREWHHGRVRFVEPNEYRA